MNRMLMGGMFGDDVGELHQLLLEAGEEIAKPELDSKTFGPSTAAAVRDLQTRRVDGMGRALKVDGKVGELTWAALKASSQVFKAADWFYPGGGGAVCDAAVADIGRKEQPDGSNDGPDLAKFAPAGRPWCALAVSAWWACAPAGSPFGVRASVASLVDWARVHGALVGPGEEAQPGDLACWLRAGGHGHVGLVVGVRGPLLSTVEGNCSNAVRGCVRPRGTLSALVRPSKARA